jgi:hypothetical protein
MTVRTKELYSSPNGDRWFLSRDVATGEVFVRHEPNAPSGGRPSHIEIGAFLSRGARNPEHQALLRLIGTLIEVTPPTDMRTLDPTDDENPHPGAALKQAL